MRTVLHLRSFLHRDHHLEWGRAAVHRKCPRRWRTAIGLVTLLATALVAASPASALSEHVFSTSFAGSSEVPIQYPQQMAIDQSTGDVYVAEVGHSAEQEIAVDATGGTFNLSFEGQTTGATGEGNLSATIGSGNLTAGSEVITGVSTASGAFAVGQRIEGAGIPPNTGIEEVGPSTLTIGRLATASATGVTLTAGSGKATGLSTSTGTFVEGEQISGAGIPAGTTITEVPRASELILSKLPTASASGVAIRADIPFDGGAYGGAVQNALGALSTIGPNNTTISHGASANSFVIRFTGKFQGAEVPLLSADGTGLTGSTSTVKVSAVAPGLGPDVQKFDSAGHFILIFGGKVNKAKVAEAEEPGNPHGITAAEQNVCEAGEECQHGSFGSSPGAFEAERPVSPYEEEYYGVTTYQLFLALESSPGGEGDIYVGDPADQLVTKFDSSGRVISSWGENGPGGQPNGQLAGRSGLHGTFGSGPLLGIGVARDGTLLVSTSLLFQFAPDGTYLISNELAPLGNRMIPGPGAALFFNLAKVVPTSNVPAGEFRPGEQELLQHGVPRYESVGSIPGIAKGTSYAANTHSLYATVEGAVSQFSPSCVAELESCTPVESFGAADLSEPQGVAIDEGTGQIYVSDYGHNRVAVFSPQPYLPEVSPPSAEGKNATEESLRGEVDPASAGEVTGCKFEYAPESDFEGEGAPRWSAATTVGCSPAAPYSGGSVEEVSGQAVGLTYGTTYRLRLAAENQAGSTVSFTTSFDSLPLPPEVSSESAFEITGEAVRIGAQINPGGGDTSYQVEYVTEKEFGETEFEQARLSPSLDAGPARTPQSLTAQLSGLEPGTTYLYRVVAKNAGGTTPGSAESFTTLPSSPVTDPCPNAHLRQQTSASSLLDCRAYELVSAANAGGYDVTSNLVTGQMPFGGYPEASGRVLYSVQGGGVPSTNHPTDRGPDPYVATRAEQGWSTEYVGIPANATPSTRPFSSTPLGADAGLETFAFGGESSCSPCFADGSTGIPLHLPSGGLVQGMTGSLPQPGATPAGYIASYLSADGSHLVFGSTSRLESDGEEGQISIYDRNLSTGQTHVVSKTPGGGNLSCETHCTTDGLGEVAVSRDGSHVLVGKLVSEGQGVRRWHLYMDANDSQTTIDLTPGATEGVVFDGMTEDGSRVFFSSSQHLTHQDEEHSGAELYVWSAASESVSLISRGEHQEPGHPGDTNECEPVANSSHEHWNAIGSEETCGIVAIGGGGGVTPGDGSVYFLSPELLAGTEEPADGTKNAPNLYLARPSDGYTPHFVATLESLLDDPSLKPTRVLLEAFGSLSNAAGVAASHETHDVYVLDDATDTVQKFDSSGNTVAFSAGPEAGSNRLTGAETPAGSFAEIASPPFLLPTQLAVDNSGGPFNGDLYVPDLQHGVVDRFAPSGTHLGQINVGFPTGVAVDPLNGEVYVSQFAGTVNVYEPTAFEPEAGSPTSTVNSFSVGTYATSVAVDSNGNFYVTHLFGEATNKYNSSGEFKGVLDSNPATSVVADTSEGGDIVVDEEGQLSEYSAATGNLLGVVGSGQLSGSIGVAIDPGGNLYATTADGSKVAPFGRFGLPPSPRVNNPAVIDSVSEPEVRHTGDFQVTRDGRFAAFPSSRPLAGEGEDTAGHTDVFRYDTTSEMLACASCNPSGGPSTSESSLARNGESLTEDGRVFFDTKDALSLADTDNRLDAYEWAAPSAGNCDKASPFFSTVTGACVSLISAGTSTFDSGLLGVDAGGTNVYFFTRDSLVPSDRNGPTMKIYDAREGGGFPFEFPPVSCQASDECHGPSSASSGPLSIGTEAGSPTGYTEKCTKPRVRRHGHCIKPHHPHRHHKRTKQHRGGRR